ncbi:hypothetical protein GJ496_004818 [Pomphorhynchus laevis]|nr:hypothetical protein GJ496_004818 [Pomphorhynchus laevis]
MNGTHAKKESMQSKVPVYITAMESSSPRRKSMNSKPENKLKRKELSLIMFCTNNSNAENLISELYEYIALEDYDNKLRLSLLIAI